MTDANRESWVRTSRLLLRRATATDVDALYALFSDPRVARHRTHGLLNRDKVAALLDTPQDGEMFSALAIALHETARPIGYARLTQVSPRERRRGAVSVAVHPDCWGRGLGTEALRALVAVAFGSLGLEELVAARVPRDLASHRCLVRAEFDELDTTTPGRLGGLHVDMPTYLIRKPVA